MSESQPKPNVGTIQKQNTTKMVLKAGDMERSLSKACVLLGGAKSWTKLPKLFAAVCE